MLDCTYILHVSAKARSRLLVNSCTRRWHYSSYLQRMHSMHTKTTAALTETTTTHICRNECRRAQLHSLEKQRSCLRCKSAKQTADDEYQFTVYCSKRQIYMSSSASCTRLRRCNTIADAQLQLGSILLWKIESLIEDKRKCSKTYDKKTISLSEVICVLREWWSDAEERILVPRDLHDIDDFPLFLLSLIRGMSGQDSEHGLFQLNQNDRNSNNNNNNIHKKEMNCMKRFTRMTDDQILSEFENWVDDCRPSLEEYTISDNRATSHNNNNNIKNSNTNNFVNVEKQTMSFIEFMNMITSYIRYHCGVGWGASLPQKSRYTSNEQFERALAHYYRHVYFLHPWHNVHCPTGWHEQEPFVHVLQWMRSSSTHQEEEEQKRENDNKFDYNGNSFSALDVSAQSGFGVDLLLKAGCSSVLAVDCVDSGVKNTQATTHEHIRERRSTPVVNISSSAMYSEDVDKSIVQTELCELLPMPCKTVVTCLPSSHSHEHHHNEQNKLIVNNNTNISHQNKNVPILWKRAMESDIYIGAGHIAEFRSNNYLQQEEQHKHKRWEKKESSEMTFTSAAKARRALARQQGRCINGLPDTLSISSHKNHENDSTINNNHSLNNNIDVDNSNRYRSMSLHEKMNAPITGQANLSEICINCTETPQSELQMTQSLCKFNKKTQSAVDVLYFHPPPSYLLPFSTIEELLPMTRRMQSSKYVHSNKALSGWWDYVHHEASHQKENECKRAECDAVNCKEHKINNYLENNNNNNNNDTSLHSSLQRLVLPWLLCTHFARDHRHSNLWTVQQVVEELRKDVLLRSPQTHEVINHSVRNVNNVKHGSHSFCIERAYLHDNGYALFVIPRTFDLMELLLVTSERSVNQHTSPMQFYPENNNTENKRNLYEAELSEEDKPYYNERRSNLNKTHNESATCISDWIVAELDGLYSVVNRKRFYNKSLEEQHKHQRQSFNGNMNNYRTFHQKTWVEQLIKFICSYCNSLSSSHLADADQLVEEFNAFCENEIWQDVLILRKNGSVAQQERACTMQKIYEYKTLEVEDKIKWTNPTEQKIGGNAHESIAQKQSHSNRYNTEKKHNADNEIYGWNKSNDDTDDEVHNTCAGIRWDESFDYENYKPRTVEAPSHLHWSDQLPSFSYLEQDYWPNNKERTLAKHNVFATGHPPEVQVNLEREKTLATILDTSTKGTHATLQSAQNMDKSKYNSDSANEAKYYKQIKAEAVQRAATAFKSVFAEELRTKRKNKIRKVALASKATQEWLIDDKIMKSTASKVELLNQLSRFDERKYEDEPR